VIDSVVGRVDPEGRRHKARIVSAWEHIAGPDVSRHAVGHALRDGELIVYVDSNAWATELSLMAEGYRAKLNKEAGEDLVRVIRFNVSKKARDPDRGSERPKQYAAPLPSPIALEQEEVEQIEYSTAGIKDDDVRRAASDLMRRDMEYKKGAKADRTNASESPKKGLE